MSSIGMQYPAAGPLLALGTHLHPVEDAMMKPLSLAFLLLSSSNLLAQGQSGADWPQWRGPEGTGVSIEAAWNPAGKASPMWVKSLGVGHSSFAVVGARVYTMGYSAETGLDTVYCLDADSGKELWTHSYASEIWDLAHDGGTTTTPMVMDDAVYTSNREAKVFCFDALSGEVRWERDLRKDLGLEPPKWGFTASPYLSNGRIVMNLGKLVALDRMTGADEWVTERDYGLAYATPASMRLAEREHVVNLTGDGLAILKADDGAEVAFFEWIKAPQIYPMTPVIIGDRIFISGGYDRGCAMLQFSEGKLVELWGSRVMRNKMTGCVLYEDHLYGFDESILKCIDLEGKMKWRKRGLGTGSMSIAGGRLVILDGKGQLIVAEANAEEYVELSRQEVHQGGTSWSTPVLAHGRIYSRSSLGEMVCLDRRSPQLVAQGASQAKDLGQAALPTAESLVAAHGQALGGRDSFAKVHSVKMVGSGESLRNTVSKGSVSFYWKLDEGFSWQDDGGFQLTKVGGAGWQLSDSAAPLLLEGEGLDAAGEAGDLQRLFSLASTYSEMKTLRSTVFDNRPCYEVQAKTAQGYSRLIYFEVESGLFAGHQGEGIPMWTLGAYQEFSGVKLPTQWAFYESIKGEMNSAIFESVSVNEALGEDVLAAPEMVRLLLRTPAEIDADNSRLSELHAELLGTWSPVENPEEGRDGTFAVEGGFLVFQQDERPDSRLSEADDEGKFFMLKASYVVFTPVRDTDGLIEEIQISVGGELQVRLAPPLK